MSFKCHFCNQYLCEILPKLKKLVFKFFAQNELMCELIIGKFVCAKIIRSGVRAHDSTLLISQ